MKPFAFTLPGDDTADSYGFIATKAFEEGEFTRPLYALAPEPVVYQYRVMFDATHARRAEWCEWHDCSKQYYERLKGDLAAGEKRLQVRALYEGANDGNVD